MIAFQLQDDHGYTIAKNACEIKRNKNENNNKIPSCQYTVFYKIFDKWDPMLDGNILVRIYWMSLFWHPKI